MGHINGYTTRQRSEILQKLIEIKLTKEFDQLNMELFSVEQIQPSL